MTLKSIIWTIAVAVLVFFIAVYLGIKYNWVDEAEPKLSSSSNVQQLDRTGSVSQQNANPLTLDENAKAPELIEEPADHNNNSILLGSLDLSIEEIVSQCQTLTQSVGIPEAQIEQAMMECIDRNSIHLTQDQTVLDEASKVIKEQCDSAITQRELLSQEEIKILVDECVASSR